MTEPPKPDSASSPRAARLREALRENLKRRKSQARGRAAQASETAPDEAPPAGAAESDREPNR